MLVGGVLAITVIGGVLLALLLDQPFWGRGIVRVLVIAPFFIMPTVSALVWKNMFMNPVSGLFAHAAKGLGLEPVRFPGARAALLDHPDGELAMAAVRHADPAHRPAVARQRAARSLGDGRGELLEPVYASSCCRTLARAITVVILIQTIFLLSIFAEILVTTTGGPGTATTNLTFLIYAQSLLHFDVGGGAAGGIIAIILANIVAIFLMRMIGKNLDA